MGCHESSCRDALAEANHCSTVGRGCGPSASCTSKPCCSDDRESSHPSGDWCTLEITIHKVNFQRQHTTDLGATSLLRRLGFNGWLAQKQTVFVEIAPWDSETGKSTEEEGRRTEAGTLKKTKDVKGGGLESWAWGSPEIKPPTLCFEVLPSSELMLRVLGSQWNHLPLNVHSPENGLPLEHLGRASFRVDEDVVHRVASSAVGLRGDLSLPIAHKGHVSGAASVTVCLRCDNPEQWMQEAMGKRLKDTAENSKQPWEWDTEDVHTPADVGDLIRLARSSIEEVQIDM